MEKDLSFKPITDGLGFHPFSDGLPYAPVSKVASKPQVTAPRATPPAQLSPAATPRMGVGATAAGRPTFAPTAPRVSVPVARTPVSAPVQTQTQTVAKEARPEPKFDAQPGFGYLIKRVVAYVLDSTLNIGLCLGALSAALWRQNVDPGTLINPGVAVLALAFLAVFNWALITAQEVAFGTSFGKRIFGLAIHGSALATFLRAICFIPSAAFCGLGLAWALVDRNKRCWHDVVSGLQPKEIASL